MEAGNYLMRNQNLIDVSLLQPFAFERAPIHYLVGIPRGRLTKLQRGLLGQP